VRITTLGGECSVSVAPFSELANRYGDDPAIVWIYSHPDVGTPDSEYPGYHWDLTTSARRFNDGGGGGAAAASSVDIPGS
jgi:arginase family enzyme